MLNFNPDLLLVKRTKIMANLYYLKYAKTKTSQRAWVNVVKKLFILRANIQHSDDVPLLFFEARF